MKIKIILLTIFVLAALAAAGYWFYKDRTMKVSEAVTNISNEQNDRFPSRTLYSIDNDLIFLKRTGPSSDYSYHHLLLDQAGKVLCEYQDSVGGPRKTCHDTNKESMFNTVITNLDKADLGLTDHKVELLQTTTE